MEVVFILTAYMAIAGSIWEYGWRISNGIPRPGPTEWSKKENIQSYLTWALIGIFWPISIVAYAVYAAVLALLMIWTFMSSHLK